jgi:hypothetical protein
VHFYSKILGKTRSNVATLTRLGQRRAGPRRAAPDSARVRAPDRLGVRGPRCPRLRTPQEPLNSSPPRAACRPVARRPTDRRSGPCPHGRASYRGRHPPLGMSLSALLSQASTRVALKGSRCSSLDTQDPPPTAAPSCRHWPRPCRHATDTSAVESIFRPRSPLLEHARVTVSAY